MHKSIAPLLLLLITSATAQERRPNLESLLKRLDKDGDGRISLAEFPRGEERFRRLDRDGDGFLTRGDLGTGQQPEKAKDSAAKPAEGSSTKGAPTEDQLKFFETKIRPVLATNCFTCHSSSATRVKGGLLVDSMESLLAGGDSGPAVVPGDLSHSLLIEALRYGDVAQMPPKAKLPDAIIADFEAWVKMGAPWPKATFSTSAAPDVEPVKPGSAIDMEAARKFWSFQPPRKPVPPTPKDTSWAWTDIDRFILAAMEEHGVSPAPDADRTAWLRRVTFDLIGLPPTPLEIEAFAKDQTPEAFERVVDRLLSSPRFGERFGRHWLDVARYGESSGKESNVIYPQAWRYRDYVIDSWNKDKPYDLFLKEQIAGDLLPAQDDADRAENLIATGFLALGTKGHNTRNRQQFTMDLVDEQIDAMSQAMLGLTVACARCHDHKFDPIPQEDYYALAGIFLSTETCYGTKRSQGNLQAAPLLDLSANETVPNGPSMSQEVRTILNVALERSRQLASPSTGTPTGRRRPNAPPAQGEQVPPEGGEAAKPAQRTDVVNLVRTRFAKDQVKLLEDLFARFGQNGEPLASNRLVMGVREGRTRDARLLERGEIDKPKAEIPRGFVSVLTPTAPPPFQSKSGRLELADWIASPENPLTSRVFVNRIWLHLLGRGLVATPDNFGRSGQAPSHPELLDWLAVTFVEGHWSPKALIKAIALSHVYRQSSTINPAHLEADPDNTWCWHVPTRRLEGEAIRDAMLASAGLLDLNPPVGSPVGTIEGGTRNEAVLRVIERETKVRSVYLPILRDRVPSSLEVFDFAEPSFVTSDREETNVATQALFLMNDEDVISWADAMARNLLAKPGSTRSRLDEAFFLCLSRKPNATEVEAMQRFLGDFPKVTGKGAAASTPEVKPRRSGRARRLGGRSPSATLPPVTPEEASWSALCQALWQSAEFRYID